MILCRCYISKSVSWPWRIQGSFLLSFYTLLYYFSIRVLQNSGLLSSIQVMLEVLSLHHHGRAHHTSFSLLLLLLYLWMHMCFNSGMHDLLESLMLLLQLMIVPSILRSGRGSILIHPNSSLHNTVLQSGIHHLSFLLDETAWTLVLSFSLLLSLLEHCLSSELFVDIWLSLAVAWTFAA